VAAVAVGHPALDQEDPTPLDRVTVEAMLLFLDQALLAVAAAVLEPLVLMEFQPFLEKAVMA
jgi:hypothetical protein